MFKVDFSKIQLIFIILINLQVITLIYLFSLLFLHPLILIEYVLRFYFYLSP